MTAFIGLLARQLLTAVDDEMTARDTPVCRSSLVPGITAAWDNCCESDDCGGQLWVATPRIYPSEQFPQLQVQRFRCGVHMLVAVYQVGVIRCAVALDDNGNPPSADRLDEEALRNINDHEAVFAALVNTFIPENITDKFPWALGEWQALGPQGGCVGGALTLLVGIGGCPDEHDG